MLIYKPHQAEVWKLQAVLNGSQITRYERVLTGTHFGQLTPKSHNERTEGFEIEIARPYVWLADAESADALAEGDQLVINSRKYRLRVGPILFDAESKSSHIKCLLEAIE